MKQPTILSLGEMLWDLFPDGERFGGAPANFACHAAVQGADVTMLSAVGDDEYGRDGTDILSAYGIDVSLMQIIPETPTGTVSVEVDGDDANFTVKDVETFDFDLPTKLNIEEDSSVWLMVIILVLAILVAYGGLKVARNKSSTRFCSVCTA